MKAASEKKALQAAVTSAEQAKAAAAKALEDMKEDATNSMLDALEAERTRQDVQRARRVEAAEREARLLEEQRIREARETREQAVEAARKAAEQEALDEVEQAEHRLKEEMRGKIQKAEARLHQATEDEEEALANLEAASREPKPLPLEDDRGSKVPPAASTKAATRPRRREASEHSYSGSSRSSEGSESHPAGKNSGPSRSLSRSASPKAAKQRRSTDADRSDGAARN